MKKPITDATNSIVSEIEISYKSNIKPSERVQVRSSKEVYAVFKTVYDFNKIEHKEMFYAMYLSRANKVLGVLLISEGGTTGTVADPKIIFQGALKLNAQSIILSHNHPGGAMRPSNEDINLTKTLIEGAKLLDLRVLDHLILSPEEGVFYSFADEGMM